MLFVFEKMPCSLSVICCYLLMYQNIQTVVHRYSLKQVFLKISQYCIYRKTPVLEPVFNKVSEVKTYIFI